MNEEPEKPEMSEKELKGLAAGTGQQTVKPDLILPGPQPFPPTQQG